MRTVWERAKGAAAKKSIWYSGLQRRRKPKGSGVSVSQEKGDEEKRRAADNNPQRYPMPVVYICTYDKN